MRQAFVVGRLVVALGGDPDEDPQRHAITSRGAGRPAADRYLDPGLGDEREPEGVGPRIVLDAGGNEKARLRIDTPDSSYEAAVQAIAEVVRALEKRVGETCSVGVAHPGAISPATGLIKNANSTRLNGHPLNKDLERLLERPVRLEK